MANEEEGLEIIGCGFPAADIKTATTMRDENGNWSALAVLAAYIMTLVLLYLIF